jgi:hypothetical protein
MAEPRGVVQGEIRRSVPPEVDHLKRQGQNVRAIEYYLSDLEASRRLGEQGAAASRYAADHLEYEIQRLNRQRGR